MEPFMIMILILLLQVILDALGDGFRARGWQKIHHSLESLQIGIWLSLLPAIYFGWLDFQWYYIWMYVLGRLWAFNPTINAILKENWLYVSKSSWDGAILYWISGEDNPDRKRKWRIKNFQFMLMFLSFVWWIGWFISNKDTIGIFIGR